MTPTRWCCTPSSSMSRSAACSPRWCSGSDPHCTGRSGARAGSLAAALAYSNIVFAGAPLVWLMNALASVIRGTGNMLVPALAVSAGVVLLVPLSPCLIFGLGPFPALGIAGAGIAVVSTNGADRRGPGPLSRLGSGGRAFRLGAAAGAPVCRDPAGRRGRLGFDLADDADRGAGDGAGRQRAPGRKPSPDTAPAIASNTCSYRSLSGLARRWSRWSGPISAPGRRERALRIAFTGAALAFVLAEAVGLAAAACARDLARPVQRRCRDARGRRAVSADRRTGLRLFRHGSGAVFRLARRRKAALAAAGRADPSRDRDRRRLDRPASDRLADVAVRLSRLCPRGVWPDDRRARSAAASGSRNREPGDDNDSRETQDFDPMAAASTDRIPSASRAASGCRCCAAR